MPEFPHLFDTFDIPPLRLKNRITMAPLFTMYGDRDGRVSRLTREHYRELAEGGAAMIVVANAAVDPSGALSGHSLRADDDRFVHGLSRLSETIKKEGALSVLQINHGGRFARGSKLFAPSVVPFRDIDLGGLYRSAFKVLDVQQQFLTFSDMLQQRSQRLREMTKKDIRKITAAYAGAAGRAKAAGFDMVEIHGGTGYLPVQFLSRRTNKRSDRYGGSLENRMRFALELVTAVKAAVGEEFPVGYRFQADEWLPDGFSLAEALQFAARLSAYRVAYLSVTTGTYESFFNKEVMGKTRQPCYMVSHAAQIKAAVRVPVIASGRIITPALAENILKKSQADLIGLARPLLADPRWPQKAAAGKIEAIITCSNCGTCLGQIMTARPVVCSKWEPLKRLERRHMIKAMQKPNKKILIALDGSETAALGAAYAAEMLAGQKNLAITLIHIQTEESAQNEQAIRHVMGVAREVLLKAGIPQKAVTIVFQKLKAGIARDLLAEIVEGRYGTVIIGRRGLSRAGQFLFGSVSNKIVQNVKDCTVWVVD